MNTKVEEMTAKEQGLPEAAFRLKWKNGAYYVDKPNVDDTDCYTADQMRAYALASRPADTGDGCEACDGNGYVVRYTDPYNRGDVSSPYDAPCGDCTPPESGGQGEAVGVTCKRCRGTGEGTVQVGVGPDAYDAPVMCEACGGSGAFDGTEPLRPFPTMLRKMWSGGDVQRWLDENIAPAYAALQSLVTHPPAQASGAVLSYTGKQPNNGEAYRIFLAFKEAKPGGDFIDHGLSITQGLERHGFGLVYLTQGGGNGR